MEKKQTRTPRRQGPASAGPPDPVGSSSGTLLAQARAWGEVAGEAHADCEKGKEAEAELRRRRNRSGQ